MRVIVGTCVGVYAEDKGRVEWVEWSSGEKAGGEMDEQSPRGRRVEREMKINDARWATEQD